MEAPEGYRMVETPDDGVYYWEQKEKDVDVRIQKSGEDYDLDLIIDGVVEPVGFYKLSNAKTEAKEIMDQNPEAENIEHHTAY